VSVDCCRDELMMRRRQTLALLGAAALMVPRGTLQAQADEVVE
jgi:hypothetical protein